MRRKKATKALETQLSTTNFPIVGIGASAGGLGAFEAFFSNYTATNKLDKYFERLYS
jgi:chemotaxis response regulator CheB